MREIKFRAWIPEPEIMLMLDEPYFEDHCELTFQPLQIAKGWSLENSKLMQYIGLKDKNGKEIYEGDIIKETCDSECYSVFTVIYKYASFGKKLVYGYNFCSLLFKESQEIEDAYCKNEYDESFSNFESYRSIEVIGNIYENPDLLNSNLIVDLGKSIDFVDFLLQDLSNEKLIEEEQRGFRVSEYQEIQARKKDEIRHYILQKLEEYNVNRNTKRNE